MVERFNQSSRDKISAYFRGAASMFDFGGVLRPRNPYEGLPPQTADRLAIKSYWDAVGKDIQSAIDVVDSELRKTPK